MIDTLTAAMLNTAASRIPAGSVWRHYKGGVYLVLGHVVQTDAGMIHIRYTRVAGPGYEPIVEAGIEYARPANEWFDEITIDDLVQKVDRFIRLR